MAIATRSGFVSRDMSIGKSSDSSSSEVGLEREAQLAHLVEQIAELRVVIPVDARDLLHERHNRGQRSAQVRVVARDDVGDELGRRSFGEARDAIGRRCPGHRSDSREEVVGVDATGGARVSERDVAVAAEVYVVLHEEPRGRGVLAHNPADDARGLDLAFIRLPPCTERAAPAVLTFVSARRARRLILEHMEQVHASCCSSCTAGRCDVCGLSSRSSTEDDRQTRIIARSGAMQSVLRRTAQFANASARRSPCSARAAPARSSSRARSTRAARARGEPFVAVNCAALPAELLETELFGHVRGAFTGARRGQAGPASRRPTAARSSSTRSATCRSRSRRSSCACCRTARSGASATRARRVDVRVVAATNRDLAELVARRPFREDLYYRLNVVAARACRRCASARDDILPLAQQFLAQRGRRRRARRHRGACALLERYAWPGNVRELANAVEHGAALARGRSIDGRPARRGPCPGVAAPRAARAVRALAEVEREHVLAVLEACGGISEAARVLGIGRNTLWRKLRAYA